MARNQVAVRHPHAVAPAQVGRCGVDVHVGRADVGDGREDHRVQAAPSHPLLQVDPAGPFQPAESLFHVRDVEERLDGMGTNERRVGVDLSAALAESLHPIGKCPGIVDPDQAAIDGGEVGQVRVGVGAQEVVPGPGGQIENFPVQELPRHQAASLDRRHAVAVLLVVGHHREIDEDDLGPGGGQFCPRGLKQIDDGLTGLDTPTGRSADAQPLTHTGLGVGVDIHPRHPETLAGQAVAGRLAIGGQQLRVGPRPHR